MLMLDIEVKDGMHFIFLICNINISNQRKGDGNTDYEGKNSNNLLNCSLLVTKTTKQFIN